MSSQAFEFSFEETQSLLLDMARERALDPLLDLMVARLAERAGVALARVWLVRPGDICPVCPLRNTCETKIPCLHLVASAGRSAVAPHPEWSSLDGEFRRFPIGRRKVGAVAASGEPICVEDMRESAEWIADPGWARAEGILGFGGQPLVHRGETLGVLGVFTRACFVPDALRALRMIADHAAAAIANARAFEEIAALQAQLAVENEYLRDEISQAHAFGDVLGTSAAIRSVQEKIEQVAPTDASVLIEGESGTGKELVAREVHDRSQRADKPLIKVNCASVPKELYESEFFGHARGSFTGAVRDRTGRFAAADGGTLFLDEVGEIPLDLQSKLLRVLQEGEYERVGEERTRRVDVRIVAATNRDLEREVSEGRFRQDLYYRLNVFPVRVPPLRERAEDVSLLAEAFLERASQKLGRGARLTPDDHRALRAYTWPGNVRELQNVIERAVITAKSGVVTLDLPGTTRASASAPSDDGGEAPAILTDDELRELERRNLVAALEKAGGKLYGPDGAAELLGLKPTTVASRLKRFGIERTTDD